MARATFTELSCDRCGQSRHVSGMDKACEWGVIAAAQHGGAHAIGDVRPNALTTPADVCADCMEEVIAWWNAGAVLRGGE